MQSPLSKCITALHIAKIGKLSNLLGVLEDARMQVFIDAETGPSFPGPILPQGIFSIHTQQPSMLMK